MVRTRAVSETMDAATVDRMISAALGSPVMDCATTSSPMARSIATVISESEIPARAHTKGISHRLVFSR
jgi:hypothetical protein